MDENSPNQIIPIQNPQNVVNNQNVSQNHQELNSPIRENSILIQQNQNFSHLNSDLPLELKQLLYRETLTIANFVLILHLTIILCSSFGYLAVENKIHFHLTFIVFSIICFLSLVLCIVAFSKQKKELKLIFFLSYNLLISFFLFFFFFF